MKSSIRFNAELQCDVIDGGGSGAPQGYYARFANDKDKIVKAANTDISRLKPEDNIENILIGKDIIAAIKNDSSFKILERQFVSGHLSIDVSTPITSLKFSDEIASYVGNSKALAISKTVYSNGVRDLDFYVPALQEDGNRPDLNTALKAVSDYVIDVLDDLKSKAELKQEEKSSVRPKLKM
ncbi:Uncharacterized protein ALO82_02885 [Pseudomonas syringae pv. broussonetiae]|nr:hypothetical protein [Pseudomonas savastanoi]KPW47316.1 Uncharacterized protein ALO82_02885 [Pseudomonas syringae pv. broussonetiae]KWT09177.1 hypothetical protein AL047_17355 [Pseudomonas syringae pv. broussonetiae]